MDQHYWPFRASGVSHPTPEQDCCLGLNCENGLLQTSQTKGVLQTSTTLVSCESTNDKLSKTIQGTMLHKTARLRAWQECGSCDDLTLWESSVWTREAVGPPATPLGLTAKVKLQRSCHKIWWETEWDNVKMKANRYSYVQNKNTYMYRSVTPRRSFFYIQCNHEILLGTGWLC